MIVLAGHFRDAIDMAFKSKILRQDLLGDDHPDTLHSALTLAQAHGLAGQMAEPVKLRRAGSDCGGCGFDAVLLGQGGTSVWA